MHKLAPRSKLYRVTCWKNEKKTTRVNSSCEFTFVEKNHIFLKATNAKIRLSVSRKFNSSFESCIEISVISMNLNVCLARTIFSHERFIFLTKVVKFHVYVVAADTLKIHGIN